MTTKTNTNSSSPPRLAEKSAGSRPGSVAGSSNTAKADAVKPQQPDNNSDNDATAADSHDDMLKPVGLFALFRFATPFERMLNLIGLVIAAAAGATLPVMTIIFGKLTSAFTNFAIITAQIHAEGSNAAVQAALDEAKRHLKKEAGNCALYFLAIGIGMFVTTYAYMLIWNFTSERQGKRIRERYLRAVLRQDVGAGSD